MRFCCSGAERDLLFNSLGGGRFPRALEDLVTRDFEADVEDEEENESFLVLLLAFLDEEEPEPEALFGAIVAARFELNCLGAVERFVFDFTTK